MIPLHRRRDKSCIPSKYRSPGKNRHELHLMHRRIDDEEIKKKHWKNAKPQLKREASGKCAYCEAQADTTAHCDVEHFRPRSRYWWLAYCWDNWLFSCQICNEVYKGDQFPIAGHRMVEWDLRGEDLEAVAGSLAPCPLDSEPRYRLADLWAEIDAERADLVDPYREDPKTILAWRPDEIECKVKPIPASRSARIRKRAKRCIEFLGLDREELCRDRWTLYRHLRNYVRSYTKLPAGDSDRQEAEQMIESMMDDSAPFAGMCRYFVREVWSLDL